MTVAKIVRGFKPFGKKERSIVPFLRVVRGGKYLPEQESNVIKVDFIQEASLRGVSLVSESTKEDSSVIAIGS